MKVEAYSSANLIRSKNAWVRDGNQREKILYLKANEKKLLQEINFKSEEVKRIRKRIRIIEQAIK